MTFLKNSQRANRNRGRTFQPPWGSSKFFCDFWWFSVIFLIFLWFSLIFLIFHWFSLILLVFIDFSWFFSDSRRLAASPGFFRIFSDFFSVQGREPQLFTVQRRSHRLLSKFLRLWKARGQERKVLQLFRCRRKCARAKSAKCRGCTGATWWHGWGRSLDSRVLKGNALWKMSSPLTTPQLEDFDT